MKNLIRLVAVSLVATSCSKPIPRPKGEVCRINARSGYILCFDLENDFDSNGDLLPNVQGVRKPVQLLNLHGHWELDEQSLSNLRAYGKKVKDALEKECKK